MKLQIGKADPIHRAMGPMLYDLGDPAPEPLIQAKTFGTEEKVLAAWQHLPVYSARLQP
jgi:hypothetical protein